MLNPNINLRGQNKMELEKVNLRVTVTETDTKELSTLSSEERNRFCPQQDSGAVINLCNKLRSNFLEATFL